jgi:DNA invertase Pin-like site-specific DNA recombinase
MKIGYARVSSSGQSLEIQLEALAAAGCEPGKIYREKESARSTTNRAELEHALADLRPGDELLVTRLDRLARSVADLYAIVKRIDQAGASFTCLHQAGIDTGSATGKLMLGVLGVVAEFENDLRRDRQREGIQKAKERGAYRGGKSRIDPAKVRAAVAEHGGASAAAKALGIGRASVYRLCPELGSGEAPTDAMLHGHPPLMQKLLSEGSTKQ